MDGIFPKGLERICYKVRRNFLYDEGGNPLKNEEISFKDLSKAQLNALKDLYIDERVESMSEVELRKFAREVLELQVRGTVGNEEEREVWKEMREYFNENFVHKIKDVIKTKGKEERIPTEEEEFQKRLQVLGQRKQEENKTNEDMW